MHIFFLSIDFSFLIFTFSNPVLMNLAAFKLVGKFLQESNVKGIGIFISNITVNTLNKFGKRARGLLRTCTSS